MRFLHLIALIATTACGPRDTLPSDTPPSDAPFIQGTIVGGDSTRVLVQARTRVAGREDKAYVAITNRTRLQWIDGAAATRADLAAGRIVSVWITGIVLDSYPVQTEGTRIIVDR